MSQTKFSDYRRDYYKLFTRKVNKSKMFPFIDKTLNPLGGGCYNCNYCYIHGLHGMKNRFKHIKEKYSGFPKLYENELEKRFNKERFVFICDCIDIFHPRVNEAKILRIFEYIESHYNFNTVFLVLTKNPMRIFSLQKYLPPNIVIGVTIETNWDMPNVSKAPSQTSRIKALQDIANNVNVFHYPRMISIEPILVFDKSFKHQIMFCMPDCVVIGYDNHHCKLYEPALHQTRELIGFLRDKGILVIEKTIRKAWWEK